MMWLPAPSGILVGTVHVTPSVDFEKNRSFLEQVVRRPQSGQAIIALPSVPTSTLGNGPERTAEVAKRDGAIVVSAEKLAPPSVERTTPIPSSNNGTTTTPFGSETGCGAGAPGPWIPRRPALSGEPTACDHVRPPSVDVCVASRRFAMSL